MGRVLLKAVGIEFEEGGNTIWVHGPGGETILRIKCSGHVNAKPCVAPFAHADVEAKGDILVCIPLESAEEEAVH